MTMADYPEAPDEPLRFDPIRNWVKMAKGTAHHAPSNWEPFDRWLDNLEKAVRSLEQRSDALETAEDRVQEVEGELTRFEGIQEAIQDVGRGIRTFPEVLDEFELDPEGIWRMPTPVSPVRETAKSEEIPLY